MTDFRRTFTTGDPELAEDMIRQVHLDHHLAIFGPSKNFEFSHSSLTAPGHHGFAINRLHHTLRIECQAEPLDDLVVVDAPRRGRSGRGTALAPDRPVRLDHQGRRREGLQLTSFRRPA